MGGMFVLECPDCGYSKEYYTGIGRRTFEIDFEKEFNEIDFEREFKRRRKTKTVYEQIISGYYGEEAKDVFLEHISERIFCYDNREGGKTPYYCTKCEKIRLRYPLSISWVDEETEKDMEYEIKQTCAMCHSELIEPGAFDKSVKCRCPKCGKRNAKLSDSLLLWD